MLYLDTEFNGHGGKLISMALVSSVTGEEFYRVWSLPDVIDPWVREHVIPRLLLDPTPDDENRLALRMFLERHENEPIIADWPADFTYLMNEMAGPAYDQSFMVEVDMRLIKSGPVQPDAPHNARSDALALMRWHQSTIARKEKAESDRLSARVMTRNAFRQHVAALLDLFEATNGDTSDSGQHSNRLAAIDKLPVIDGLLRRADMHALEARR